MLKFLLKKLFILTVLLAATSLTVHTVLFILPGDPAQIILGMNADPESLSNLRAKLGLDRSYWEQYCDWIGGMLSGRSSQSINYHLPVSSLIMSRLLVTAPLALMAMILAVVISIPMGIYAARHQNRAGDLGVMFYTQLGLATPEFWLGILLILLFSVQLGWFNSGGFPGWSESVWGSLKALLLPAAALGVIRASILTRVTRSSMLEVLREDYVRTAWAKGLGPRKVIYVHALRNAMIPILTIMGLQFGQLIAGAIIIENVFYLPGLGRLVFLAIGQRDLPVVREIVLFMAGSVVLVNFLVDLTYRIMDPRIRLH